MSSSSDSASHFSLSGGMGSLARSIVRHAGTTLAASFAAAALAILAAGWSLQVDEPADPFEPASAAAWREQQTLHAFSLDDEIRVIVQGDETAISQAVARLESEFNSPDQPFAAVLAYADLEPWRDRAMHYLSPPQLEKARGQLTEQDRRNAADDQACAALLAQFDAGPLTPEVVAAWEKWFRDSAATRAQREPADDAWYHELSAIRERFTRHPLFTPDRSEAVVYLQPRPTPASLFPYASAVERASLIIASVQAGSREVQLSLAGRPVEQWQRYQQRGQAILRAWLMGLIGVAFLALMAFGRWRHAAAIFVTFLLAQCWTAGLLVAITGRVAISDLLGLFAVLPAALFMNVRLVTEYLEHRQRRLSVEAALATAARNAGPELLLGSAVLAAVAGALALLHAPVGAGWILLCTGGTCLSCVATLVTLPALIAVVDAGSEDAAKSRPIKSAGHALTLDWTLWLPIQIPRATFLAGVVTVFAMLPGVAQVVIHFQLTSSTRSEVSDPALQTLLVPCDSLDEARRLSFALAQLPDVSGVDELASHILPSDDNKRRAIVRLAGLLPEAENPASLSALAKIEAAFNSRSDIPIGLREAWQSWRSATRAEPVVTKTQRTLLQAVCQPDPPRLADLSPLLVARYVNGKGEHLLRVHVRHGGTRGAALRTLVAEMERLAPQVSGELVNRCYRITLWRTLWLRVATGCICTAAIGLLLFSQRVTTALAGLLPATSGVLASLAFAGWTETALTANAWLVLATAFASGIFAGGNRVAAGFTVSSPLLALVCGGTLAMLLGAGLLSSPDPDWGRWGPLLVMGAAASTGTSWWLQVFVKSTRSNPVVETERVESIPTRVESLSAPPDAAAQPRLQPCRINRSQAA